KMVTAMAALESGAVKPTDTPVYCTGAGLRPGSSPCIGRHGNVNLATALAVSCNTYFQEVALKSGIDAIYDAGLSMGLGRRTGIELPGEAAGILPNPAYKRLRFAPDDWEYNWHNYDTFNTAIGQGYNLYTPLQLANYVAAIANGGKHMQPYLLDKIISGTDGKVLFQAAPRVLNTLDISAENLAVVQLGMRMAVQPGGTAAGAFAGFPLERFPVAAKTGTAQVNSLAQDFHGVYVAYAPANNPQVAFACVIEYGRTGGGSAGLVCRAVFEQYFGLNPQPIPNELPESME
ncbi:MAG: penicillin-binding transpeptidase domain-containing protein, partial [Clostridiales bacterium]|nr:penicillin-binding transpeptidase domain-containing protein [Clostridiales bacterium]